MIPAISNFVTIAPLVVIAEFVNKIKEVLARVVIVNTLVIHAKKKLYPLRPVLTHLLNGTLSTCRILLYIVRSCCYSMTKECATRMYSSSNNRNNTVACIHIGTEICVYKSVLKNNRNLLLHGHNKRKNEWSLRLPVIYFTATMRPLISFLYSLEYC